MSDAPDTQYLTRWFVRNRAAGRSARRLADGERFAGYEVLGLLGRGGSGEVYRARPVGGGAAVALKVLREDRPDLAARMRREAEILAAHPHPALPRLVASGEEAGRPWLAVEELVPRDLPSSDRDVARFLLALCDGVGHLHALGLVHRDIKPGNILFRPDGSPVLIDLGLVKDLGEEAGAPSGESPSIVDGSAVGVGTPGFSAPEQFSGGKVSPAADVYALGVLADACFGHRPPRRWRALLRRATSALEAERPVSAGDLARAIRLRRLPSLPAAVAALALAGAAATAVFALLRPAPAPAPVPAPVPAPPAPGEGPWRVEPPETDDPRWNATIADGKWTLAALVEDDIVQICPDYSRGAGKLDLSKPVLGTNGAPLRILSIGFDPEEGAGFRISHDEVRVVGSLRSVILPDTLVELGPGALMNCGNVTNVALPASLRRIGPWAFSGCRALRRVRIPAGVEDVSDDRTFMDCSALEAIDVEEGSAEYRSDDGVLLSADGRRLVAYPPGRPSGRYAIPEGVEAIPAHAFVNCGRLAGVAVPASVRSVGTHSFIGCPAATNLVFAGRRPWIHPEAFQKRGR